jgi:tRNA A-37 threonylcarbamoyl transferase component Bud32/tetratricopeptide (TPR) repeat protein
MERIGKYDIVERIGKGGYSTVYKGFDPVLQRYAAIKVMSERYADERQGRDRFQKEARMVARLEHKNIVRIYDFGEHDGLPYIAMEYVKGSDLDYCIKERTGLGIPKKIDIVRQIAEGLTYAHRHDIFHCDIKPPNVRIQEESGELQVKIMDFGIAMMASGQAPSMSRVKGTVYYMAPEQIRGFGVDARTDIFAVGVLFYELLSYRRPFSGRSISEIRESVLWDRPAPLKEVHDTPFAYLEDIVFKCLNKNPDHRYVSCKGLVQALGRASKKPLRKRASPVIPRRPEPEQAPKADHGARRRHPGAGGRTARKWIGGAIAAAFLIVVGLFAGPRLWRSQQDQLFRTGERAFKEWEGGKEGKRREAKDDLARFLRNEKRKPEADGKKVKRALGMLVKLGDGFERTRAYHDAAFCYLEASRWSVDSESAGRLRTIVGLYDSAKDFGEENWLFNEYFADPGHRQDRDFIDLYKAFIRRLYGEITDGGDEDMKLVEKLDRINLAWSACNRLRELDPSDPEVLRWRGELSDLNRRENAPALNEKMKIRGLLADARKERDCSEAKNIIDRARVELNGESRISEYLRLPKIGLLQELDATSNYVERRCGQSPTPNVAQVLRTPGPQVHGFPAVNPVPPIAPVRPTPAAGRPWRPQDSEAPAANPGPLTVRRFSPAPLSPAPRISTPAPWTETPSPAEEESRRLAQEAREYMDSGRLEAAKRAADAAYEKDRGNLRLCVDVNAALLGTEIRGGDFSDALSRIDRLPAEIREDTQIGDLSARARKGWAGQIRKWMAVDLDKAGEEAGRLAFFDRYNPVIQEVDNRIKRRDESLKLIAEAKALDCQGNYRKCREAKRKLERALDLDPNNAEAGGIKAKVDSMIGGWDRQMSRLWAQGRRFVNEGDFGRAVDRFRQIKEIDPTRPGVQEKISECENELEKRNRPDGLEAEIRRLLGQGDCKGVLSRIETLPAGAGSLPPYSDYRREAIEAWSRTIKSLLESDVDLAVAEAQELAGYDPANPVVREVESAKRRKDESARLTDEVRSLLNAGGCDAVSEAGDRAKRALEIDCENRDAAELYDQAMKRLQSCRGKRPPTPSPAPERVPDPAPEPDESGAEQAQNSCRQGLWTQAASQLDDFLTKNPRSRVGKRLALAVYFNASLAAFLKRDCENARRFAEKGESAGDGDCRRMLDYIRKSENCSSYMIKAIVAGEKMKVLECD